MSATTPQQTIAPGRYLRFLAGDEPTLVALEGTVRIGRNPGCEITFEDPTVSRRHARLVCQDDQDVLIEDRRLNGTFVSDERVTHRVLQDGDVVGIGRHALRFIDLSE